MVKKTRETIQSVPARMTKVKTEVCEPVTVKFEPLEDGEILQSLKQRPDECGVEAGDVAAGDEMVILCGNLPSERSHSQLSKSSLGPMGGLDDDSETGSSKNARRSERDHGPELTMEAVPETVIPMMDVAATAQAVPLQENSVNHASVHEAPDGVVQARSGIPASQRRGGSSNYTDISGAWLLDPALSSKAGMVVTIHGSRNLDHGAAWHGGDYEGASGVVLSVHNTGSDDGSFPSIARIKFFKPLNPSVHTFAVPVSILWPVRPEAVGEHAVIIGGAFKGHA
ncbi:hypothetical protein PYCCODRAFT_610854 [Trametes coccinea BRFM310]|uniref:Uncharacterized protein n=1 Tax=Trametes coccinea (strain BRFM310) TaxID=1353009 RepID=A0A1Y2J1Y9_TRAC3|nr:hypothetical protein PYCCODRAFT_610854 [Trametes coccinea BRFM310]